ncbi:MAG: hypothetical protein EZS28_003874 [Streblomastix strix]|uniref:Uncharacterized protein n=1 Tax=Streblomastix strix TaxID=222440 RepID=A0A5J4WZQ4_9EUKA|nr:MAG: hypothetical protein EZS28_003874 [Streblomastix strix]
MGSPEYIGPLLQKPPSVPRLFAPHKIGLPAEQLTDPCVEQLFAPVHAITLLLKVNVHQLSIFPEFEFGSLPNYTLLHQLVECLLIGIPSLNVPLADGITYTNLWNVFIPANDQFVVKLANQLPLNVNVFPSADIYKPLILSPAQDVTATIKPQGLISAVFGGVNIVHYPSISPVLYVLQHPNQIDEFLEFSPDLAIFKPSSQLVAMGFIYILPYVFGNNQYMSLYPVGNADSVAVPSNIGVASLAGVT